MRSLDPDGGWFAVAEYGPAAARAWEVVGPAQRSAQANRLELVIALEHCLAMLRDQGSADPEPYRREWESVAGELAKLPPSLVRRALAIIGAERQG